VTGDLAAHVRAAIAELRRLRCDDPAAERALEAAHATAYTLELWWLPALDELVTPGEPERR
jgi:hypothetical protein